MPSKTFAIVSVGGSSKSARRGPPAGMLSILCLVVILPFGQAFSNETRETMTEESELIVPARFMILQ